ncbi:MAG: dihydrofolate reductase [Verrucomicrobiota bacterium]
MPKLIAIVAMASNRIIGRDGDLPWRLSEDLKFFKRTTMGHAILMGRKTWDSIGRPLPGRRNVILSRSMDAAPEGADLLQSVDDVPQLLREAETVVYLIGGAEIYRQLLNQVDEILLSYVHEPHEGDTEFPPFEDEFELTEIMEKHDAFEIRRYVRKDSSTAN